MSYIYTFTCAYVMRYPTCAYVIVATPYKSAIVGYLMSYMYTFTCAYVMRYPTIADLYGMATISRLLQIIRLFCRISSLL